jgi:hypothetical protein
MDTCGTIFSQPFFSGDDIPVTIQFFQSDGVTAQPMTGYTISLMVKSMPLNDQFEVPFPDSTALFYDTINGDDTGVFPFLIPGLLAGSTTDAPTLPPGSYFMESKQIDPTGLRSTVFSTSIGINQSVRVSIP